LTTIPVLNSAGNVRFADVSGDGYGDLLVGHATAGLGVFRGDALGGLTAAASYFGSAYLLETIDLEGDGRLDVFAAPSIFGSGTAAVYLNASPVPGVSFFGVGTPGCNGILGLTVNSTPNVGNLGFRILGTNAPKRSLGLTIVSDAADFVGSDPFGLGETLYTDFFNSLEVFGLDANTDLAGSAVTVAAIPSIPALVGKTYYAQTSYIEPKGLSCGAALFGLVTTRGLAITIAP
jgi:hypothetical protein